MAELLNDLVGACNAVQRSMADFQGYNYAYNLGLKLGYLDFITSGLNKAGGSPRLEEIKSNGKIKKFQVFYSQRLKDDQIKTGTAAKNATLCDTAETFEEKEAFVEIDERIATPVFQFSNEQLNELCENPDSYRDRYFLQEMKVGREKLNKVLLAQTDAASGKIIGHDGTTTAKGTNKSLKLIAVTSEGDRKPLIGPWAQIELDYENMELTGTPAIIGQGILNEFFTLSKWSCCNAAIPFDDAVALSGTAFFLDQTANKVMGANEFVVVAPGSQHLLTYNENRNLNINTPTNKHIVIQDPVYPEIQWDMDWRWNECDKTWDTFLSFWYKLFNTFQADSFNGSGSPDRLLDITGITKYIATAS